MAFSSAARRSAAAPGLRAWTMVAVSVGMLMVLLALLPAGPREGAHTVASSAGRILGQLSLFLLAVSLGTTYVGGGQWRTRLHAASGALILALVAGHVVLLLVAGVVHGWLSGLVALLFLAGHGVVGAWKVRFLRRHGAARWRFTHLATGWTGMLLSLEHAMLYGRHFGLLSFLVQ